MSSLLFHIFQKKYIFAPVTHTDTQLEARIDFSLHDFFPSSFRNTHTHTNPHKLSHLFLRHAVQLCMPGGGVRAVIGRGRGKVLQYDWVSLLTQ